ncbi:MAG: efflux RND transporter periplasmic adaptor subunit [Bacteroidetes bacterium]|nr:efflux RND transporter periplasmic adaptor subunit [Bacteroidota bacterium]
MKRISILPFLFLSTLLFTQCGAPEVMEAPEELVRRVTVDTEILQPELFRSYLKQVGTVTSDKDAILSAEVQGRLLRYTVSKGERVQEGQMIAKIDDATLKQEVRRMEAMVRQSKLQYDRQKELFEKGVGSQSDLDNAELAYEQQDAALASLRVSLNHTELKAPFSGTLEQTYADPGELLSPGTPIARVVNTTELYVTVGIPSRYVGILEKGDPVRLQFNQREDLQVEGRIQFVGATIDPQSRSFEVEVRFPNPNEIIKIDMVADVEVVLDDMPNSIVVGEEFVFSKQGRIVAYIVAEDAQGNPISREIEIDHGPVYKSQTVILSGLNPGDQFITNGSSYLQDGTRLQIRTSTTPSNGSGPAAAEATLSETLN